jgi:tetratricopeptide (TPR) repeat protein
MSNVKRSLRRILESSVWRALGVYALSSWITLLVIQVLTTTAGLPAWFPELALGILLLGLPLVLTIAYVRDRERMTGGGSPEGRQEGPPEEVGPAAPSFPATHGPAHPASPSLASRRFLAALAGTLLLAALVWGWFALGPAGHRWSGAPAPAPRVAVLPYLPPTPTGSPAGRAGAGSASGAGQDAAEDRALSDALHRDLVLRLAGVEGVSVLSREAVEALGLAEPGAAGAGETHADVVLRVELERGEAGLRLNARLLDSRGRERWSETFSGAAGADGGEGDGTGGGGDTEGGGGGGVSGGGTGGGTGRGNGGAGGGRGNGGGGAGTGGGEGAWNGTAAGPVFAAQAALALRILESVRVSPAEGARSRLETPPTRDLEAFLLYALGLAERREAEAGAGREAVEATRAAERRFLEATERDPSFGAAWSALSEARSRLLQLARLRRSGAEGDPGDSAVPEGGAVPGRGVAPGSAVAPESGVAPSPSLEGALGDPRETAWETAWDTAWERAWVAADRALRLDPMDPLARLALGDLHARGAEGGRLGGMDRAVIEYRRAAEGLPGFAPVHRTLGEVERRTGHWDRALASWERAVELDPGVPRTRFELGYTHHLLRRYGEALPHLEAAAGMAPELEAARTALLQARLSHWGELDSARVALEALPDPGRFPLLRFQTHFQARDFGAAAAVAASELPDRLPAPCAVFTASRMLGMVLAFTGQVEGSRNQLTRAREELEGDLARTPDDPGTLASLGEVLALRGDGTAARHAAERAVRMSPVERDAVEGPACLAALARTLVLTGRIREAVDLLEWTMAMPGPTSTGELRFDPTWDPLRSDPRFQRLMESAGDAGARDP